MKEQFSRTELLLGREALQKLFSSRVAVFGLGGVGGYTVEALARSGIGTLDLTDPDKIAISNLNRQILATWDTVGKYKVDAAAERIRSINPDITLHLHRTFFLPDTADQFDFSEYDYVVDAVDTVTGKLELVQRANEAGTPIISCMGAGNKMDASAFEVADIYETSICPLARIMRKELKKRGIEKLKVVYSREPAMEPLHKELPENGTDQSGAACDTEEIFTKRRQTPGSNAFVPAAAGLILAGEVIRDLTHFTHQLFLK
ncbi:MAG: tRNA threonylcarbamoyladenosine dehydratase [Clostridiales bacterium]|nr:tRNA threonylcarbamoyladenosine dehydratase [Clostridiales bacterium]